ncbi:hypothetical protein A5761_01675 [Mycolicibacterium setense]|uniref:CaiB/BaiF CoA transferase family protein n=1 Tax=Mycolicibacterium setense TaxID=431269 RepID=UPI0007E9A777|nr:CoA transferase [Mycolicibacterium setense]OBB14634.1 hypothetical protein A5761_01675 [Mycolicibacterium setense]
MDGPLAGVVVLDLGQIYNAPYATLLLALAGADVIKIEPLGGELTRARRSINLGAGMGFVILNSNKRCVTLNLKDARGRELLIDMANRADVLVENFRPGVMDRLGVGAAELRRLVPALVYASGSGYGQTGRYRDLPAMDLTVQAMSGAIASTGFVDSGPVKSGPAISDFLGGIHLYGAIVTALYQRAVTGRGATLDVAMLDSVYPSLMSNVGPFIGAQIEGGPPPPERTGNRQGGLAESPYNVYPTKDGDVAVICLSEAHWRALTEVMERPELVTDPRYADKAARIANMDEVDALVAEWTAVRTTDEVFAGLRGTGVVCAPARSLREVIADPYFRERGLIEDRDVPGMGTVPLIHTPLNFVDQPRIPLDAAHDLGADNDDVYGDWLGRSADQLSELRADGVI